MVIYGYFGGWRGKRYKIEIHAPVAVAPAVYESFYRKPLSFPIATLLTIDGRPFSYSAAIFDLQKKDKGGRHALVKDFGRFSEQIEAVRVLEAYAGKKLKWALDPRDF